MVVKSKREEIIGVLKKLSEEEAIFQSGSDNEINKAAYTSQQEFVIEREKFLLDTQQIDVRKHPRYIHFPKHRHDFIEINYVLKGQLSEWVGEDKLNLVEGELLLLNQHVEHELSVCDTGDLIVNFIIDPKFFDHMFQDLQLESASNSISNFLMSGLFNPTKKGSYLYYKIKDVETIQVKILAMIEEMLNRDIFSEARLKFQMGLLLIELMEHASSVVSATDRIYEQQQLLHVLNYIENNFRNARLDEIAENLRVNSYQLSKQVKKWTNKTFIILLQERRIREAKELLFKSDALIEDIAHAIGYENLSYFYRLFKQQVGVTPREYRLRKPSPPLG